jgi:PAS domain S-box-containing protein
MNKKVLVVDDQEGIRKVLDIFLSDLGYRVYTAENADTGWEIFKTQNPSIVLTDIKMPGKDGIEILRDIKAENPDTEVIMITGHGDMDLAIKSLKYEATDFITKPINNDVLEIALKRAHEKISMRHKIKEHTENLERLVQEKSAKLVEAERQLATIQVVEGLSSAMQNIIEDFQGGIRYFNEMPCFVSIHDRNLNIVAVNQLYRDRLGDKTGSSSWEIYPDYAGEKDRCPVGRTFTQGKGLRSKETILCLDGKGLPVIVHTAPICSSGEETELVIEISADVTEMRRLQEELRETQKRYQQLFDEAPCYICVIDGGYNIVAANRLFMEDFGDKTGQHCYEVYKHRTDPCPECVVKKTFEDGRSYQIETVVTSKGGEQINVLIWTAPIRDAKGQIIQVMEMSTNITQVRKLQDHLTSLGLLIGSISHGVKGLLTGLDGGMYRVDTGIAKNDRERLEAGWRVVKDMVERIRNMVLDILYYAKKRDLKWERVDVLRFAEDVALIIEAKANSHQIEIVRDFEESVGEFEIDPGVVSPALVNILENAIDACTNDLSGKTHKIIFGVKAVKDDIHFDVRDNGLGMDPETMKNIFSLFFSSKGSQGTGLGLFISKQVVEQHGGSISVDAVSGEGSHFVIKMPKALPDTARSS